MVYFHRCPDTIFAKENSFWVTCITPVQDDNYEYIIGNIFFDLVDDEEHILANMHINGSGIAWNGLESAILSLHSLPIIEVSYSNLNLLIPDEFIILNMKT